MQIANKVNITLLLLMNGEDLSIVLSIVLWRSFTSCGFFPVKIENNYTDKKIVAWLCIKKPKDK